MVSPCPPHRHHAIAIPLPAQGHISPLMRLCKLLASRHAFLITFVNIDHIHHRIQAAASQGTCLHPHGGIRMAYVTPPTPYLSNGSLEHFFESQKCLSEALEDMIRGLSPPATCIISDVCMTSPTQLVAERLRIPRVVLYPSSQCFHLFNLNLTQEGGLSIDQGTLTLSITITMAQQCNPKTCREPAYAWRLEGLAPLQKRDLPSFRHIVDDTSYVYHFMARECKIAHDRSHAIVVNSFLELESDAIQAFSRPPTKPPLFAVGPLIEDLHEETSTSLWQQDDDCITWLDKQTPASVLYISFGSVTLLSRDQFEEILFGLEASNQRFLWAIRPNLVEGMTSIPKELLGKTCDHGYFATWAPQLSILKHPSMGAFLTHCGWNSTMESIASGVPMICWPYYADQFMNARYITEEWKVGLAFQLPCNDDQLITKIEIERVIRTMMECNEGKILRKNARKLKEVASKSLEEGGSSWVSMKCLVESLHKS